MARPLLSPVVDRPFAGSEQRAADAVMHDLVDTVIQEDLFGVAARARVGAEPPAALADEDTASGESWWHTDVATGRVWFRVRPAAALQPYRLSRPPVWHVPAAKVQRRNGERRNGNGVRTTARAVTPAELLELLLGEGPGTRSPGTQRVVADLRTAVRHASVTLSGLTGPPLRSWPPGAAALLAGERLAATRNRPFHPTSRAVSGWSGHDLARYGPTHATALPLDWVAVPRDRLRHGTGPDSGRLHELLLSPDDQERLRDAVVGAGVAEETHQPLPVHPWQLDHVLLDAYGPERAAGDVRVVARGLGGFTPTASVRTLAARQVPQHVHVKLPLGVATLGAVRLLPPRYLDNGERAQRVMEHLTARDGVLGARVRICDERDWAGWRDPSGADEFADRPGHLAAQVRRYPGDLFGDPDRLVLPMAALASHEWPVLSQVLDPADPVGFFRHLAETFCEMALSFLAHGVLPELHGQNVLVTLRSGASGHSVDGFVLRDHDTLRLCPEWMAARGVPDPGYRIRPGARQSLRLPSPDTLLGYLTTLGFQVNLYGIADALARAHQLDERLFWEQLGAALTAVLRRLVLPERVVDLVERNVLGSATWPSRQVLGPLLGTDRLDGVSMPAATGTVPNPLCEVMVRAGGRG